MSDKNIKSELNEMIYSGFSDLSKEEIKDLIKKEVEKGPDAANPDYIDFCFELLKSKDNTVNEQQKSNVKPSKVLLVAAIIVIVMLTVLTASAIVFDIPQKIAEKVNGNAELDYNLEYADTSADGYALTDTYLFKELASHGITPVTLPEYLTSENSTITNIYYNNSNFSTSASIDFEYNGYSIEVTIDHYFDYYEFVGEHTSIGVKSGQMIRVNGMDILVFEHDDYCTVRYKDNLMDYRFLFNCDLDMTLELVKSIK